MLQVPGVRVSHCGHAGSDESLYNTPEEHDLHRDYKGKEAAGHRGGSEGFEICGTECRDNKKKQPAKRPADDGVGYSLSLQGLAFG